MKSKKDLLANYLNGKISKEQLKKASITGRPIIIFDGDVIPTAEQLKGRPIITFGDTSIRQ